MNTQSAYYIFHYLYVDDQDTIGQTGKTYYDTYYSAYAYLLEEAENALLMSEPYYSTHYLAYYEACCVQARYANVALLISIFIAYLLAVLTPKYLFKDGKTIAYKLFGLGVINDEGEANPWYITLLKSLIGSVGFSFLAIMLYMVPPFNGVFDAMFFPNFIIGTKINLGTILMIVILGSLLINVVMLFTHYRKNIINLIFHDKVVDIHYLDEGDNDDQFEGRSY